MHESLGLISVPHKLGRASPGTWEVEAGGSKACHQAEELAYSVESLSYKHKNPSLDHCHLHKALSFFKISAEEALRHMTGQPTWTNQQALELVRVHMHVYLDIHHMRTHMCTYAIIYLYMYKYTHVPICTQVHLHTPSTQHNTPLTHSEYHTHTYTLHTPANHHAHTEETLSPHTTRIHRSSEISSAA